MTFWNLVNGQIRETAKVRSIRFGQVSLSSPPKRVPSKFCSLGSSLAKFSLRPYHILSRCSRLRMKRASRVLDITPKEVSHQMCTRGDVAVGQNQWYHFGVGAPPVLVYFSGDWDVHWGNWRLTMAMWVCFKNTTLQRKICHLPLTFPWPPQQETQKKRSARRHASSHASASS